MLLGYQNVNFVSFTCAQRACVWRQVRRRIVPEA
jgi:hypothetical protein